MRKQLQNKMASVTKGQAIRSSRPKRMNKNVNISDLLFREEGQLYAVLTRELGDCRFEVFCFDESHPEKERWCLGHVRGVMRKRKWVTRSDLVLVSVRDFDKFRVDIIHKYSPREAESLCALGEVSSTAISNLVVLPDEEVEEEIEGFAFVDP